MTTPEAYIQIAPGLITDGGEVTEETTEAFLRDFIEAFAVFITRVLSVSQESEATSRSEEFG
jgi:chromate reductase